jgi:nicotinate-nucleotide pyrophosphorylase (carboxylating)
MMNPDDLRRVVRTALDEDLGAGDITSEAIVPKGLRARGVLVAREPLVVAGLEVAREVFGQVDPALVFHPAVADGADRRRGETLASVEGAARSILAGERTALNFLQRMCGIATMTREVVRSCAGARVEIADTRKTAPGLRALDKWAVRVGGGTNHRTGLYDGVLIKDNHWRLAGGVGEAVRRAREAFHGTGASARPIEVEVGTVEEADEAIGAGADALLLDNMDESTLRRAVALARGRVFLEVSGGVSRESIPRLAALGVDRISLGSLTHSVRAADLALETEGA